MYIVKAPAYPLHRNVHWSSRTRLRDIFTTRFVYSISLTRLQTSEELTSLLERASDQPENPFVALIPKQHIAVVPSFTLESGEILRNVPIAYRTWGTLRPSGDNALVICHAVSGSADVADWWGELMGTSGRAFDVTRFYIICLNSLGSPYGSASPVTCVDGDPKKDRYGPEFPLTTIRDDVNIHKMILDDLGIKQLVAAVGGSMGGMLVLEYAYFGVDYVRTIVPIATSSRHSAWGISWGEQQRQSIYCDPKYDDGYYALDDPPTAGLSAARMSALLTYRSRDSFETRFGRNIPDPSRKQAISDEQRPLTPSNEHWAIHNDGHKRARTPRTLSTGAQPSPPKTPQSETASVRYTDPQFHGATILSPPTPPTPLPDRRRATTYFSAQSYLRYQGEKFVKRFDSNCYIAMTRKLDTHDVSRHRVPPGTPNAIPLALSQIKQPALVLGIESDGLFTFAEQQQMADGIPNSRLRKIDSPEGHDAFLLQFAQVNKHITEFFTDTLPDVMNPPGVTPSAADLDENLGTTTKTSTFGEAEVEDITAW